MDRSRGAVPNGHDEGVTAVTTYTVGFGPIERHPREQLDDLAAAAGVNGGVAFRAEDRQALQLAFGLIIGLAVPVEICDGRDNDCDGRIDEGLRNACDLCGPEPVEVCNGLDDDCDLEVDEGVRNSCGECGPQPVELCNGQDDDCDGLVDEGACVCDPSGGGFWRVETCDGTDEDCDGVVDNGVSLPCGTDVGQCELGARACHRGAFVETCVGGVGPVDERCDSLDNDCDGLTDGHTRTCGDGLGECASGRQLCVGGAWGVCQGAKVPAAEVCNGTDDDCDGAVDEGVRNSCGTCGSPPVESCDGEDDDCDGRIDDGAQCPGALSCAQGACAEPCAHGECPLGLRCVATVCAVDPCRLVRCSPGDRCDRQTGGCVDPCAGVDCPGGESCDLGQCVRDTCRHVGCPPGEVCRGDLCEPHPCAQAACGEGRYCRDGVCVDACDGVRCDAGLRCVEGACVAVGCVDAQCPPAQACVRGECAQDPCGGVQCPLSTTCIDGQCVDPPCRFVVCPTHNSCEDGVCISLLDCGGPTPPEACPGCATDGCPDGEECVVDDAGDRCVAVSKGGGVGGDRGGRQ